MSGTLLPTWGSAFLLLAIVTSLPAQTVPNLNSLSAECRFGDSEISSLLRAVENQPAAELYERLGIAYGRNGAPNCAIAAFQDALALDSGRTQTRYELALALIEVRQPAAAAEQLRAVIHGRPDSFAAHNALGLALGDLGHIEEAADEFKTALQLKPVFALADYDFAQLMNSQKAYKAAIYYLKQGLAASPTHPLQDQMTAALAVDYANMGNYEEAIPPLRELVAAQPNSAQFHYDLATAYAHRQNYADAVVEYNEVLRIDPAQTSAELLLAKALLNQSKVEEALPYLRDYASRNPREPEGLQILGGALKDSNHSAEAIEILERALRSNPSNYQVHYDLGVVLGRSGKVEDAIHELRTAVKLKPDSPEARYQLARRLTNNKEDAEAKKEFEEFDRLKRSEDRLAKAAFLSNQASGALQQGHTKEAIGNYEEALNLEPQDPKLHYNLAIAFSKAHDHDAEQRELMSAVKLDPKFSQAHNQLGADFLLQGKFAEAEKEFRAALSSDPQSADALNNLGTALGRLGKDDDAERLFRRGIDLEPQAPIGYVNLGLTLAAQKKYGEAERQLRAALELDPKNASALTALGMLQGKTGQTAESIATFHKLSEQNPESSDAHLNLGMAFGNANDLNSALLEFSEAVRLAPDSALAHYQQGRVLYALHRNDEARPPLEAAIRLSPSYVDALYLLGVIEHTSPRATELFRKVLELDPGNSQARLYLGRNLLQDGKREEAIVQWKKALETDPDNSNVLSSLVRTLTQEKSQDAGPYVARLQALEQKQQISDRVRELSNFAIHAAEQNDWIQAVGKLQEAIELCGQCVELGILRKNIGLIYARKGDVEQAREQLQLALQLLPEGPDMTAASEALQRLNRNSVSVH